MDNISSSGKMTECPVRHHHFVRHGHFQIDLMYGMKPEMSGLPGHTSNVIKSFQGVYLIEINLILQGCYTEISYACICKINALL